MEVKDSCQRAQWKNQSNVTCFSHSKSLWNYCAILFHIDWSISVSSIKDYILTLKGLVSKSLDLMENFYKQDNEDYVPLGGKEFTQEMRLKYDQIRNKIDEDSEDIAFTDATKSDLIDMLRGILLSNAYRYFTKFWVYCYYIC